MKKIARSSFLVATTAAALALVAGCTVNHVVEPPPSAPPPVAAPAPAAAPPPAPRAAVHPAYLHALTDLRNARFNLERKGGDGEMKWDEREAVGSVDHAIQEIKQASIDDGKDLNDHPPVDAHEPRAGRLHRALAALRTAREDIGREEDNAYANGLKARALHHIDEAIHQTEQGIAAAERAS